MTTAVATWGNSEAVRLPKALLARVGLSAGDQVELFEGSEGCIVIKPVGRAHRRVRPKEGVTASALFAGYDGERHDASSAWPDDVLVGAERDAWLV